MILPEEDQRMITDKKYLIGFPFDYNDLKSYSPSLPLHFDRHFLPQNLCEKQMMSLAECLMSYNYNQKTPKKMCQYEVSKFESCRRIRDVRIVNAIKKWELLHIDSLDKQNKSFYNMGLNRKLTRLDEQYEMQPSTVKGIEKMNKLQFQIKELKWRLNYINNFIDKPEQKLA